MKGNIFAVEGGLLGYSHAYDYQRKSSKNGRVYNSNSCGTETSRTLLGSFAAALD